MATGASTVKELNLVAYTKHYKVDEVGCSALENWQVYTTPNEAVDHAISIAFRWLCVYELQADATLLSPTALLLPFVDGSSNFMMSSIEAFPSFSVNGRSLVTCRSVTFPTCPLCRKLARRGRSLPS